MELYDHFSIISINDLIQDPTPTRDFTENAFNCFKQALFETSWDSVKNLK